MDSKKITLYSLLHSIGVVAYIALVALLMNNAERILGQTKDTFWDPVAFLLLFTVSAAITGLLVLGRPIYLFLSGNKKEALTFLFYTLGWLVVFTVLIFLTLILTK
jgi:hypothetical protein